MLYFAVPNCEVRGCVYWRIGNNCIKHGHYILVDPPIPITMQNIDICKVHQQLNAAKVQHLLEGK